MRIFILFSLFTIISFAGCLRDNCTTTQTYIRFDPIYKTPAEFRTGIVAGSPRAMKKPGKIYTLGHYLFINEQQEGIHVVDNSDPSNPRNVAFWAISGNVDMTIRDNYLYADQYVDLLTIDIQDLNNPRLLCRNERAFQLLGFDATRGFLVGYAQTEVTEKIQCDDPRSGGVWFNEGDRVFVDGAFFNSGIRPANAAGGFTSGGKAVAASAGIAGSYARFATVNDILYTVDNSTLRTWDIKGGCPVSLEATTLGWNIETIFPWKNRLFIGSQTGVFIFNNDNPQRPVQEAVFSHANGCDPVVCDDTHAYVTIHSANTCRGTFNQLDVLNIQKLPAVTLVKSYPMKQPKGLSIAGKYLYLCDDGLKIFDRTNDIQFKELSHVTGLETYDVIALDDTHILVVGSDGFFQYDVSDPSRPQRISSIMVQK